MRGQCWRWAAAAALVVATSAVAHADLALTYVAPADCPDEATVRAAIDAELDARVLAADGTTLVIASLARVERGFGGTLTVVAPGQTARAHHVAPHASCAIVSSSLVVALGRYVREVRSQVVERAPHSEPAPPPPSGDVTIAVGGTAGLFPSAAPMFSVGGRARRPGWLAGGRARFAWYREPGESSYFFTERATATVVEALGQLCAHRGPAEICAEAGAGLRSSSYNFVGTGDSHLDFYGVGGVRAALNIPFGRRVALAPAVEVLATSAQPRARFLDDYFAPSQWTATFELALVVFLDRKR